MYNRITMAEIKRVIYACDIGSTLYQKKRGGPAFGWARLNSNEGTKSIRGSSDIQQLIEQLQLDIEAGYSVSLGFESPLFIPIPDNPEELSKKRAGDGDRSWSAPAGAAVTTLGIHQSAWILNRLHESSSCKCEFTLDWKRWPPKSYQHILFCWEAFVSGKAHSAHDMRDAATAVVFFFDNERNLQLENAVKAEKPISLIGAVALWSGWTSDLTYLHNSTTLVLKPSSVFEGEIQEV
jgi:hypothetical protein